MSVNDLINHYDSLIEENNDPILDSEQLREYMDKWDGQIFIDELHLTMDKSVLEIGIGTGRLALKTVLLCKMLTGIDISPKTIKRASENLADHKNVRLICGDFLKHNFMEKFDVIYSSLTFMHIKNKSSAINKIADLLNHNGRFVLSIDKNQSNYIDTGNRKIAIYPDNPNSIRKYIEDEKLKIYKQIETEFAYIIISGKI